MDHAAQLRAYADSFITDGLEERGLRAAANEIERLRAALEPFAGIADLVDHTPQRDGEVVFRLPKPDWQGYWTLVRDDFRRASAAFTK